MERGGGGGNAHQLPGMTVTKTNGGERRKKKTKAYTMLHSPPHNPLGSKRKTNSKEKEREIILHIIAQHRYNV